MFALLSNKRYLIFIIFCIVCIFIFYHIVITGDSETDIIDTIKMMNKCIYSFAGNIEYEYTLIDTLHALMSISKLNDPSGSILTHEKTNFEIYKENKKIRIIEKRHGNNNMPDRIITYDGEESRNITYRKVKNKFHSLFYSINNRLSIDIANCDPFFYTNMLFEIIVNNLNTGNASILEITERDGVHIIKFSIYNGEATETYWFSEQKMFRPIKIITESKTTTEVINIDYIEKNGYYVPKNIKSDYFHSNGNIILT